MLETIIFNGTEYNQPSLGSFSGPELVKIYNAAAKVTGGTETKRFPDKSAALKRTWEALRKTAQVGTVAAAPSEVKKAEAPKVEPKIEAPKADKPAATPKAPKVAKERQPRGMYFMFPHRAQEEQKTPKKGTMRAKLFQLLSRDYGATFEQLLAATWGDDDMRSAQGCSEMTEEVQRKTCYEATRLIHYFNGFGLYHAENDHVFVYSTREEKAAIAEKYPQKKSA
jgi:hypothetical protein